MDAASLTDSELHDQVRTWCARVARGDAVLLDLVGEIDHREVWGADGIVSCAHWLSWQLGWSMTTAREKVRVARDLRRFPQIRAAFHRGELSYSRVRGVTRVATPEGEEQWLALAKVSTGEQLEKVARGAARARALNRPEAEKAPEPAAAVDWDDDGDLILTLRIPAHQAVPVLEVLKQHQAAEQTERDEQVTSLLTTALDAADASAEASAEAALLAEADAHGHDPLQPYPYVEPDYPYNPHQATLFPTPEEKAARLRAEDAWRAKRDHLRAIRDAWNARRDRVRREASARRVTTGKASLVDGLVRAVTRPTEGPRPVIRLMVDPLSGWGRTQGDELLPPATLHHILRAFPGTRMVRGGLVVELTQHDQGRASRTVSPALRRLLGQVDGERCRFPGCDHTRFLHAHHVTFWRDGGPTDLANLVLLCTRHHRLLHLAGYLLTLDPDTRALTVQRPDGTELERHPALPDASAEALPAADPVQHGCIDDRFDLGYVVHVMLQHAA
jgi:hypothetical protein